MKNRCIFWIRFARRMLFVISSQIIRYCRVRSCGVLTLSIVTMKIQSKRNANVASRRKKVARSLCNIFAICSWMRLLCVAHYMWVSKLDEIHSRQNRFGRNVNIFLKTKYLLNVQQLSRSLLLFIFYFLSFTLVAARI